MKHSMLFSLFDLFKEKNKKKLQFLADNVLMYSDEVCNRGHRCCSTFIKHECKLVCNMAVMLYIV